MTLIATHHTDPGCPWAYSAWPAIATLRWRYGDGLDWRLNMIGLADDAQRYVDRGYTPERQARGFIGFRRYGMPFATEPRARMAATGLACRAVVAARELEGLDAAWAVFRALQFAQFTSTVVFDEPDGIRAALTSDVAAASGVGRVAVGAGGGGSDSVASLLDALDDPATLSAYEADKAAARTAAGSPTEFQGKAADTDGHVRYTAPSITFEAEDGARLEAGGFQPIEAYDVVVANLDTSLARRPPAADVVEAVAFFEHGLTTAEVAAVMCGHLQEPALRGVEEELVSACAAGDVRRVALGDGALWVAA